MLTRQDAEAAVKKHGSQRSAAKALGVAQSTISDALARPAAQPSSKSGRSLSEFRAEFDRGFFIPKKIKDGLKLLGDGWEYEVSFAKLCGISLADLGNFRDQFADYIVVVKRSGKRAWAATPALASRMREMVR